MGGFSWLPKDDPKQAIRIGRVMLAFGYSFLYLITLSLCLWQGIIPRTILMHATIVVLLLISIFYLVFRLGFNKKFRDPSLTTAQLLTSIFTMLYVVYFAPETRQVFVVFLLISIMFGMLRLSTRDLLLLGGITLLGYLGVTLYRFSDDNNLVALRADLLQWFVLAITLPSFILMGARVRKLRTQLREASFKLEGTEDLARRDELTGAYNRRYLNAALHNEKVRCDQANGTFCIAIIDIDLFKNVNDSIGHLAGDDVLQTFAQHMQQELRHADIFGRYGGEEFIQILPDTSLEGALIHAERTRNSVEKIRFPQFGKDFGITISIGVAQYEKGESILHTFARADEALYQAKAGGRNRVAWQKFAGGKTSLRLVGDNVGKPTGRQTTF